MAKYVTLNFSMHQPRQLRHFSFFEIDNSKSRNYFEDQVAKEGKAWINSVVKACYAPLNQIFAEIMEEIPDFAFSLSISGITLELLAKHSNKTLEDLQDLVKSKRIELVNDTYYHSLSWLYSKEEFAKQIVDHRRKIWECFKQRPQAFAATSNYFSIEMASFIKALGFRTLLVPTSVNALALLSLTTNPDEELLAVINQYKFDNNLDSDLLLVANNVNFEIDQYSGFSTSKYAQMIAQSPHELVNIFLDYEDFGLKNHEDSGVFEFIRFLPEELDRCGVKFLTPKQLHKKYQPQKNNDFDLASFTQKDYEKEFANKLQQTALNKIYHDLEKLLTQVVQTNTHKDTKIKLLEIWRGLQSQDHINFMNTVEWQNEFSPYESPYDAYINYMNVVNDFSLVLKKILSKN